MRNELIKRIPRHLIGLQELLLYEKYFVATHARMRGTARMRSFTEEMTEGVGTQSELFLLSLVALVL